MISSWLAAKNRLSVLLLCLLLLMVGVVSCRSGLSSGTGARVDPPKTSLVKKIFSKAATAAAVSTIEDVNLAADADNLVLAWLTRSQTGPDVLTVAGLDDAGRQTYRSEIAGMPGMHSVEAGLVGSGHAVVTWRAEAKRSLEAPGEPIWSGTENLYMAVIDASGSIVKEPTVIDPVVSNFGWLGPSGGWTKITNRAGAGFAVYWYNSNDFELRGEQLIPRRLVTGPPLKETDGIVAQGNGWVVRQGSPVARRQRFSVVGEPDHDGIVDTLVGDQLRGGNASETAKVVEALDVDSTGYIYTLNQIPTGPGKRLKGREGARAVLRIPVEVRLTKITHDSQRMISGRVVANSNIYEVDGKRPVPSIIAGTEVLNIVWPISSESGTSYKLSQFTIEGMQTGPETEVARDDGPGLETPVEDKAAFATSDGPDLAVDLFSLGGRSFGFNIEGANQGRISSFGSDIVAVWLGAGDAGEELQAGRWHTGD